MAKRNIKSALSSSLQAEGETVRDRFEKAESLLKNKSSQVDPSADAPPPKEKVIRDSFTLPSKDYELIATIRQRCLKLATNVNKSEVIRAGLHILESLSDEELLQAIERLEKVKTGRPIEKV